MRLALAGLSLIIAAAMLALTMTAHGPGEDEAQVRLLLAGSAVALGALVVRARPGMAAVLLGLAGLVTLSAVGPGHRYLAAYAAALIALALLSLITAGGRVGAASKAAASRSARARPPTDSNPAVA